MSLFGLLQGGTVATDLIVRDGIGGVVLFGLLPPLLALLMRFIVYFGSALGGLSLACALWDRSYGSVALASAF